MLRCWVSGADARPPFAELVTQLSSQLGDIADYFDFSAPIQKDDDHHETLM